VMAGDTRRGINQSQDAYCNASWYAASKNQDRMPMLSVVLVYITGRN